MNTEEALYFPDKDLLLNSATIIMCVPESTLGRNPANSRLFGIGRVFDLAPFQDPFEDTDVVAKSGPHKAAVGASTEPVNHEEFRQFLVIAERQPTVQIGTC